MPDELRAQNGDQAAVYSHFRDYIKHEDSLINNRMTWMLTIHGFLYATFGFTVQKLLEIAEKQANTIAANECNADFLYLYAGNPALHGIMAEAKTFLYAICFVGLAISGTAMISISSAYSAVYSVREVFERYARSYEIQISWTIWGRKKLYKSRAYLINSIGTLSEMPLLTGGGRSSGAKTGFGAAWLIPLALILSWIASLVFLYQYVGFKQTKDIGIYKCQKTIFPKYWPASALLRM